MLRSANRNGLCFFLWCAALALPACGGGGSNPAQPNEGLTVAFTSSGAQVAKTVTLRQIVGALRDGVGPERVLSLEVVATGLRDVGSVHFTVEAPANLLQGDRTQTGDFLGADGATLTSTGFISGDAIRLEIARPANRAGVDGGGVIATVDFLLRGAGNGSVRFVDAEVRRPDGAVDDRITFVNGGVVVR